MTEKLPTKTELRERLQKAVDTLNHHMTDSYFSLAIWDGPEDHNLLQIRRENLGHILCEATYSPEPKPPEQNAIVVYYDTICRKKQMKLAFSSGRFYSVIDGPLCISKNYNFDHGTKKWDMTAHEWYCPSTGQKSAGWQDDWTPEEYK